MYSLRKYLRLKYSISVWKQIRKLNLQLFSKKVPRIAKKETDNAIFPSSPTFLLSLHNPTPVVTINMQENIYFCCFQVQLKTLFDL